MNKITRVCEALNRCYGKQEWTGREPVLDQLVLTILTQNTTAKNCHQAFAYLRERFPVWDDVRLAHWEHIADAIKAGGLANRKAPRIKKILEEIYERQGNLDLEWIANTPDEEAMDYLMAFDGVGRKTAACVLMFALNRPVMPVDTHVHRVAARLGLIDNISVDKAHGLLQKQTPPERIYSLHVGLVLHGRQVCRAIKPECNKCILQKECKYFVEQTRASR